MKPHLVQIAGGFVHSNNAQVARTLGIEIIAGHHLPGARLPGDAELISRFGVSRPVLRESVKTLAAKGLLASKTRVGTVVRERAAWNMFDTDVLAWHLEAGVDGSFLRDLADIRLAVEPRAAALAAARRTDADMAAIRAGLAQMRRETGSAAGFADGDFALHLAVASASGNPFMRSVGAVVEAALRATFILSAPAAPAQRRVVLSAHQLIVDTIEAQDCEGAADAMTGVIMGGLRRLGALDDSRRVG